MAPWPSFTRTWHTDQYDAIDPSQRALDCSDKVVIVTGGGRGIGKAIAIAFGRAHARGVALVGGRTRSTLEEAAAAVREASGGKTDTFVAEADITVAGQVRGALEAAIGHFDGVVPDILVNNVGGVAGTGTIENLDIDEFMRSMDLNVRGPLTVLQAFMRAAEREPERARAVINIASGAAHIPYAIGATSYAVSKMAGTKVTEFAHHERPHWRVCNMQPGVVATELARLAGRTGMDTPELPGAFAVWLAVHPDADFLNGRFVWANWDVGELIEMKKAIVERDLLTLSLKGWAEDMTSEDFIKIARSLHNNANRKGGVKGIEDP